MVILKAKYASDSLRQSRAFLEKHAPSADWYQRTRDVVLGVFEHRKDLASGFGDPWRAEQLGEPQPAVFKESLDGLIRALNCTDEIRFSRHPVLLLTALGILFLSTLAGGTVLYYHLFLSR